MPLECARACAPDSAQQPLGTFSQPCLVLGQGVGQNRWPLDDRGRPFRNVFLDYHMRIRPSRPKGGDTCPTRYLATVELRLWPWRQRPVEPQKVSARNQYWRLSVRVCRDGTSSRCCICNRTLVTPAIPAALSVWPMFDLTEPSAQNCLSWLACYSTPVQKPGSGHGSRWDRPGTYRCRGPPGN